MRTGLRLLVGKRIQVVCRAGRVEQGFGEQLPRLLVYHICSTQTGEHYSDHMWLRYDHALAAAAPKEGAIFSFKAAVIYYIRTTSDGDYGLARIDQVEPYESPELYERWERRVKNQQSRQLVSAKTKPPKVKIKMRGGQRPVDFGVYCEDDE